MGEEMMDILKSYETDDGYLMEYTHSVEVGGLEDLQTKIESAESIGLKALVIPRRIRQNCFGTYGLFEIHYYKYTKLDKDVLKHMKQEDEEVPK